VTSGKASYPIRRAAAARNRDRILDAARDAFTDPNAEVSMAQIARRAGVGMATLYRNFPGRQELLEALYVDEVDALCVAAGSAHAQGPGAALTSWLRRLFDFIPSKRLIVAELLEHNNHESPIIRGNRIRALAAGRPLLVAAQDAHEIRDDLTIEQIFDMIVAIARIQSEANYVEPMLRSMLDGLSASATDNANASPPT
jgi:AcrR family transcriptional regulator